MMVVPQHQIVFMSHRAGIMVTMSASALDEPSALLPTLRPCSAVTRAPALVQPITSCVNTNFELVGGSRCCQRCHGANRAHCGNLDGTRWGPRWMRLASTVRSLAKRTVSDRDPTDLRSSRCTVLRDGYRTLRKQKFDPMSDYVHRCIGSNFCFLHRGGVLAIVSHITKSTRVRVLVPPVKELPDTMFINRRQYYTLVDKRSVEQFLNILYTVLYGCIKDPAA